MYLRIKMNWMQSLNLVFRNIITVGLMLLLSSTVLFAQEKADVPFKSKNFPGQEQAFDQALEAYRKGDYYFLRGAVYFPLALEHYLKAQEFNPNNADLNYQIGLCYLNLQKDRLMALPYLERARSLSTSFSADFLMALGSAYQYNLEFDKAILLFEAIRDPKSTSLKPTKEMVENAEKRITECQSGIELIKNPVRVRIDNLGPEINSQFPDYSPVLPENESKIIFTSRREQSTGKMVDPEDSLFFEDIYISYKIDSNWAEAKNIGVPVNTNEHDASIYLSADGKRLLIYRTSNGGDIYESVFSGVQWSEPKPLQGINSKWYENHASYSPDNKQLYFISNRKDSTAAGGKDLYVADILEDGSFANIRNAGNTLNTKYDEDGVYLHPDGKSLYFSSKGHNSMGGFDIFKSTLKNGTWSKPENLGYPINSPEDDVFFVPSSDGKKAFFASYRPEGFGDKDIYVMHFLKDVEELSSLQFTITDDKLEQPLEALIEIRNLQNGQLVVSRETRKGETIANVPVGATYEITVIASPFQEYKEILEIPFEASNQVVTRNIALSKDVSTTIKGQLTDRETLVPLAGEIEFQDLATKEVVKTTYSARDGQFEVSLPVNADYLALSRSRNYGTASDSLIITGVRADSALNRQYMLTRINRTVMSKLQGKVYDINTGKPVLAKIQVTEYGGISMLVYSKPGSYDCIVFNGADLTIQAEAEGFLPFSTNLMIDTSSSKQEVTLDIPLVSLKKGSKMVLNNIFFDFNKATLRPTSYKTLNNLLQTMQKHPGLEIEISGHTDNIGTMAYNQRLSESRALVVRAYLIRNGIAASRLKAGGRSFKEPIATNDTPEGRQLNRRTEIKIIGAK